MMQAARKFYSIFLLDLLFDPENGGDMFNRTVDLLLPEYKTLYLMR
jgi:hypothetical protein